MPSLETSGFKKQVPKTLEAPSRIGYELHKWGTMLLVSTMLFLQSCNGVSHERASSEQLKNNIENPDLEKVNPAYLGLLQSKLDKEPTHSFAVTDNESYENIMKQHNTYAVCENDSDIVLDMKLVDSTESGGSMIHIQVDKATGVATVYAQQGIDISGTEKKGDFVCMVVTGDGQVVTSSPEGYYPGEAKTEFENAAEAILTRAK
jgi:hypothetical protein